MTSDQVKRVLRQIGLRPQIAAGQNFLLNESVAERMVAAADVQAGERVLEIGPGLGILTAALLKAGAEVVGVELDRRLAVWLRRQLTGRPKFRLIEGDIFRVRLSDIVSDNEYKLVANLPYGATSLAFRNFLTLSPRPISLTVMIQKEVAARVTARPGAMSVLSVMVQYYSRPSCLFDVPRTDFFPAPNVDSAVVHCQVRAGVDPPAAKNFFRLVRAGFSSRRKQLRNSLATGLHLSPSAAAEKLVAAGVTESVRAQDLSLAEWRKLSEIFN